MDKKLPNLSETTLLGAFLIIGSAVASVVGAAALFWHDNTILLAILAGSGWTLSACLLVINGYLRDKIRTEIPQLQSDLLETKQQSSEWSATANNVSSAMAFALEVSQNANFGSNRVPSRRARARQRPEPEKVEEPSVIDEPKK